MNVFTRHLSKKQTASPMLVLPVMKLELDLELKLQLTSLQLACRS